MGLLRTVGRTAVISGTATRVSNNTARRQQQRWAQQDAAAAAAAPPAPAPAAEDDTVAQLQRFAALHQSGVLTDAVLAAAKAKVLGL